MNQPSDASLNLPEQRRRRLRRALRFGFGVQYWGETFTADHLAAAPHGVFIIETSKIGACANGQSREVFFTPDEVRQIGQNGRRPVLGYFNLAKIEPYRDYWIDALASGGQRGTMAQVDPQWIGPSLENDGTLARFWLPEWEAILTDRVDRLLLQGVDGLFLDDVLQYYTYYAAVSAGTSGFATLGGPLSVVDFAQTMMKLIMAIAQRARQFNPNALIIVNNGIFIGRDCGEDPPGSGCQDTFDRYRSAIDGIVIESAFASGGDAITVSALHDEFASVGIPILTIDFATAKTDMPIAEARTVIARRSTEEGFTPYVADNADFTYLYPPNVVAQVDFAVP